MNGFVTDLLLQVGNYAAEGTSNFSIIDSDSFWIDGYFEETKLARLCVGDRAEAKLMGYSSPITGHVATVTRGVSVSNAAAAQRRSGLYLGSFDAASAGPYCDRQGAARSAAGIWLDRDCHDPERQG